jgi:DNA-binding NarL/FixJ family response regulator
MTKKVFIAESNKVFLDAQASILSSLGFTVVGKTGNKSEIADLVQANNPDLLVLDHDLSTGVIAKELKNQNPQMKILVIGYQEALEEFVEEILMAGFDGFWSKYDNRAGFLKSLKPLFP